VATRGERTHNESTNERPFSSVSALVTRTGGGGGGGGLAGRPGVLGAKKAEEARKPDSRLSRCCLAIQQGPIQAFTASSARLYRVGYTVGSIVNECCFLTAHRHTIETCKIITGRKNIRAEDFFNLHQTSYVLGDHCYKPATHRSRLEVRRNYFSQRVVGLVGPWNRLPSHVMKASTVNTFKNRFDRWKNGTP